MSEGEDRVQAFAVAAREESLTGGITQQGSANLEAVLAEVLPRSRTASAQGVQSILVRLDQNVTSLEHAGQASAESARRLHALTKGLNPPDATNYPSSVPGSGGILKSGGPGKLALIAAVGAAAVWFFFLRKRGRG